MAVLVTESPRAIELYVKRARQSLGRKVRPQELKAAWSEPKVIQRFLSGINRDDVSVVAVVVDKQVIMRPPADPEDIYRAAVSRAVRLCLAQWPQLHLHLDKRYTNSKLRQALEQAVSQELSADAYQGLLIWHEDSQGQLCLQAVDFVAWAIARKYEWDDESAYAHIASRIAVEEVINESLW